MRSTLSVQPKTGLFLTDLLLGIISHEVCYIKPIYSDDEHNERDRYASKFEDGNFWAYEATQYLVTYDVALGQIVWKLRSEEVQEGMVHTAGDVSDRTTR